MRRICLLVLFVAACGARQRPTNPAELPVEDVAIWFVRAALAGDEATATSLSLQSYLATSITKKANEATEWDASIRSVIEQLGKEGNENEGADVASAQVIERRTLNPKVDEKVLREIQVAVVKINVRERDGRVHASPMPWMFVKTEQGWKFSPK